MQERGNHQGLYTARSRTTANANIKAGIGNGEQGSKRLVDPCRFRVQWTGDSALVLSERKLRIISSCSLTLRVRREKRQGGKETDFEADALE